ncbi:MAG: hypothetical protein U5Q03_05680 [Bacteroidota bacterium]|nr:hypothetical protein [Bacteroidota bacterium]
MISAIPIMLFLLSCVPDELNEQAGRQFGDQHFKSAIALVELHKTRFGEYPASLDSLRFLGSWDNMFFHSVEYERLDSGYALNIKEVWMGKMPGLDYPPEFFEGLGLRKSNILK